MTTARAHAGDRRHRRGSVAPSEPRKSLGDGAPPFQFYVGGPQGNLVVVPPLAADEAARRRELARRGFERFADLHARFAPPAAAGDASAERQPRASSRERQERGRRRVAVATRARAGAGPGAEELDFEDENLPASVRRLVRRIGSGDAVDSAAAAGAADADGRRLARRSRQLCASDGEAEGAPRRLPGGVRRLATGLQSDSEWRRRRSAGSWAGSWPGVRRRGNSCPGPAWSPTHSRAAILDLDTPCPLLSASPRDLHAAADLLAGVDVDAPPPPPGPPRRRHALARLGPRLLESLHLRAPKRRRAAAAALLLTDREVEVIEGARWKIVELAFRFGGKHRDYLVQAVNMFAPLIKYGRRGGPHVTRIHCSQCGSLQWQHKRGGHLSAPVDLADVLHVAPGRRTAVFLKYETSAALDARSFSLILADRTLDLQTHSEGHRDWLMSALRTLVSDARHQRRAEQQAVAERAILHMRDSVDWGEPKTRASRSATVGGALPLFPSAGAATIRAV